MHEPTLRVVAWETTRRCALACRHCRGAARDRDYSGELSTDEGRRLIDAIADFASPILILTGGEPMTRPDIYELARYATDRGLRTVMAPCGYLITPETAQRMIDAGIRRISVSLDGPDAATHDAFRGTPGAFDDAVRGLHCAREAGIEFQINTTLTKLNADRLPEMLDLAVRLGAVALDVFFLVPTGRGADLRSLALSPEESERALNWIAEASQSAPIRVKPTCAPQYARILRRRGTAANPPHGAGGCMAGRGFVFISHTGIVQPCGFLDLPCGDLRDADFDFRAVYENAPAFRTLRRAEDYHGKCGACEFRRACGGCRARAFAADGDWIGSPPDCPHVPAGSEHIG
jgi:AdoMet-dependent heme synthase